MVMKLEPFVRIPVDLLRKKIIMVIFVLMVMALKDVKSNNSNFAFISRVHLTEPVTNTRLYGESIARIANVLGDSKPIIQSLKDLRSGRRSTWHRINQGFVEPTLKDCVAGDLALVLPHRIITNILEGLQKLDKIILVLIMTRHFFMDQKLSFLVMKLRRIIILS